MPAPAVVVDELGHGLRLGQGGVDGPDEAGLVEAPPRRAAGAQVADRLQLGLVVGPAAGPPPRRDERIQLGERGQPVDVGVAGQRTRPSCSPARPYHAAPSSCH